MRKTAHFLYFQFTNTHNSFKYRRKWRHSNLICSKLKQSHVQNLSSICQSMQEKVLKTAHFLYSKLKKRHNSIKNWRKWRHSNFICITLKQSYAKFQLNNYVQSCRRNVRKTGGRMETRTDGQHQTKSWAKFQLNISQHAGENCEKLCISYILSSKRGITPSTCSKIDAKWRHSEFDL